MAIRLSGNQAHWQFFVDCYNKTYHDHGSLPYLNLEFFTRLGKSMPENVLLILALRRQAQLRRPSVYIMAGRYMGGTGARCSISCQVCISKPATTRHRVLYCERRALFEGGAQGEHKLARGFLPVRTWSAHWLAHPEFASAIASTWSGKRRVDRYLDELNDNSPFRKDISK